MVKEETPDVDPHYVKHFKNHVIRVSSHLDGTDHEGNLHPSYFSPNAFWSPTDKDLFFHALAVHSKLRPDLIAAEVPGKTIVDVCVYLDLLASASAKEPKKWNRSALPPAIEVSDKWIEFEEKNANAMAAMEATWEAEHREDRRAAALHAERRALRKHRGERPGGIRDREDEKMRKRMMEDFQAKQEVGWKKDDYMGELCLPRLIAIDSILREAEESRIPLNEHIAPANEALPSSTQPVETRSSIPVSLIDPVLLAASHPLSVQPTAPGSASQDTQISYSSHLNHALHGTGHQQPIIFPTSIASAAGPVNGISNVEADAVGDNLDKVDLACLSPVSRRRHQKRLYMRRKRAERAGGMVSAALVRLKPGRKTNKKPKNVQSQHNAQHEALRENMNVDEEPNLGDAQFLIRPEEEKDEFIDIHSGKEEIEIVLDGDENTRGIDSTQSDNANEAPSFHPHIGGATMPYKIKEELSSMGYNAETLVSNGLGLFHVRRLSDLMSLYSSLQEADANVATRISATVIQLLHAEVVAFLVDLLHRTIAMQEQERLSKKHTKVWRLGEDQIKVGAIYNALEVMGAEKDKKKHFASLTSRISYLHNPSTTRRDEDEDEGSKLDATNHEDAELDIHEDSSEAESIQNSSEDDEDINTSDGQQVSIRNLEPTLPLHREIFMPIIWHESFDQFGPDPHKQSSRVVDEDAIDVLTPVDNSALVDELLEEEAIDVADIAAADEAEAELWARFGPLVLEKGGEETLEAGVVPAGEVFPEPRAPDQIVEGNVGEKRVSRLKYGKPGKRVKSNVYIDNSD